jgi:hypothetical protein
VIEIQLELDGEWLPLFTVIESGGSDRIGESRRILSAGLFGIRINYEPGIRVDTGPHGPYYWKAWRYSADGKQFAWQSGTMAAPAFADL